MPIIGIITNEYLSLENHPISIIYKEIETSIIKNGGIPIGITLYDDYKNVLNICDGVIFQGGDSFGCYDSEVLKYLYDINKPVLGICLGMQLMGSLFNGDMIDITNHKDNSSYVHDINIKKDSKLYDIFKSNTIKVNSRHKSVIKKTDLNISALSTDGYIEAIEDTNKKFFIGVQWHPESMVNYDDNQNKLFKYFINCCKTI